MPSILVTGGAGFIGSHLVELLLTQPDLRVVVLDNFNDYYDPQIKRDNIAAIAADSRVPLVEADFRDSAVCRQTLAEHQVKQVIHLGAYPGVPYSLKAPQVYIDNNITGTVSLLEAARQYPIDRFLFASSSTVYGRGAHVPFVEDAPLGTPASPYGATKRSGEILGLTYHALFGIPFTSLRFFNVYGPRLRPELALAVFTRAILAGTPLPLFGDGSVLRDFTHVSDICRGVVSALSAPNIAGQSINLGHNEPIEIRRLIALIESAAGNKAVIEHRAERKEDMPVTCADLTKAGRLLGYKPTVSIEDGVREYVDWFRRHMDQ
jgi:UDP-glucuronate 4-epimerase